MKKKTLTLSICNPENADKKADSDKRFHHDDFRADVRRAR